MQTQQQTRPKAAANDNIGLSIYVNKLLNTISKAVDALESYNSPTEIPQIIDLGARCNLLSKRLGNLADVSKEDLWNLDQVIPKEGRLLRGDRYQALMQVVTCVKFDTKNFKETHPRMFDKYSYENVQHRTLFQPRG